MNNEQKIKKLQKEIEALKQEQANCNHTWKDVIYDPEKVMVQDDRKGYETHGVDSWPVLSFHEKSKDRWSRECSKCGVKQYTYQNEVVVTRREPKF